jgi:hypothetical protein
MRLFRIPHDACNADDAILCARKTICFGEKNDENMV